ncbi:methyltransferase domain-containing protein [Phytomonospora endophytica]|uniref:Ubiquinone/menaquinone biosynthesis C-methylase UbiE n=1 Tax=Phytomonospora endophytica TaxID=714109 RepID=A0A841FFD9_9ACTN|nr:methyltransferase domain-containing protein [Phytomonospora endophytica]MBB6032282.1 ubiquinone/menaquinone biosynthesis C-methylase UbiE [Phytomonospora endophytica]GIG68631.1 hypothetical protein Pen01_49260 [Phytomonospora endophytica]
MRTNDAQFLVLSALADGPLHGYAVNAAIERTAGERLGQGSLYGALSRLEGKGLVEPDSAGAATARRRPMRLTDAGRAELDRGLRAMSQVFEASAPGRAEYLDRAAASEAGRAYKPLLLDALDIGPTHTVLDLGCGTGADLPAMAAAAAHVIGLDSDPDMAATAAARTGLDVVHGDAHALPFAESTVDRVRTDRVLQHVDDPTVVLAEAMRVLRPGGRLVTGEPDWETLAIDHPRPELATAYTRFVVEKVIRNPTIGRQLHRLAENAGFDVPTVIPVTPTFRDPHTADQIFGFQRTTRRAVDAGYMTPDDGEEWLGALKAGPFLATVVQWVTVAVVPAGGEG